MIWSSLVHNFALKLYTMRELALQEGTEKRTFISALTDEMLNSGYEVRICREAFSNF